MSLETGRAKVGCLFPQEFLSVVCVCKKLGDAVFQQRLVMVVNMRKMQKKKSLATQLSKGLAHNVLKMWSLNYQATLLHRYLQV